MSGLLNWYASPEVQLGMGLLSANNGQKGSLMKGLQTGMNNAAVMQQRQAEEKQKQLKLQQAADQRAWMTQNMPTYANAPSKVQEAAIAQRFRAPKERKMYKGADKYNYWTDTNERVNPGLTLTPTSPLVQIGGQSYEIPPGYMLNDPNNPGKGVRPIPGSKPDSRTPADAAKITQFRTAKALIPAIQRKLFHEYKPGEGIINIDKVNMFNAAVGTPFSEGRTLDKMYESGIQAITRGETGAAMPPEEVENTRRRFQPGIGDSDELIAVKFELFRAFLGGTLKLIDPSGSFDDRRFDTLLNERLTAVMGDGGDGWSIEQVGKE